MLSNKWLIAAGLLDVFNVFIKICLKHVPIIPIIPRHGVVFGKADFGEAELERLGGEFSRFPGGMPTERGVHVVIRGQRHHRRLAGPMAARQGHFQNRAEMESH